ncbi:hypothetical protein NIES4074_00350 [Cylindrospermum sp. NIES-4074]|nr:hypothetical protein NIES4074_00350 [Cylindrospermum sp. NIES-4074]
MGQPVDPVYFTAFNTVPELFDAIEDAIARNAYRLDAKYDRKLGYPTEITIDYSAQQADEGQYISIQNLEVIR